MYKINGLVLKTIHSCKPASVSAENKAELITRLNECFASLIANVVLYLDFGVYIGTYDRKFKLYNDMDFSLEHVQRIRVFTEDRELMLVRGAYGRLNGRYRIDKEAMEDNIKDIDVIDAEQVVFGTDYEKLGDEWAKISEVRGTELIMPDIYGIISETRRLAIKTRNYIGYTSSNQATYVDSRFVEWVTIGNVGGGNNEQG